MARAVAVPGETTTAVLRPNAARPPLEITVRTAMRSGLSRQPALPIARASQARAFASRSRCRCRRRAANRLPSRPLAADTTAYPDISPATAAPPATIGSGIAEPDSLQTVKAEQAPHPEVAHGHHRQHREEKQLAGERVKRVEVG